MSVYLGDFRYGQTIYVPFATYGSNGESITMTGIATTDIEIWKNGSVTQRASDNGYTLLDTDGIDFDSITGVHGFSIDTSDNSTAGFFGPGNEYWVALATITVNSQTVTPLWTFSIENRGDGALNRTTIATLSTQVSWTLTAGSADNDAYNGCMAVIHDQASAVQKACALILDYTGSTKTVTLIADPAVFTMATGDYVTILPRTHANVEYWKGTAAATVDTAGYPKVTVKSGTGTGEISLTSGVAAVNATSINSSANAAARFALASANMIPFTVNTAGFAGSSTTFQSDLTEATADHYKNGVIKWTTGALAGQSNLVEAYVLGGGLGRFTMSTMTDVPANGDTGIIV